MQEKIGKISPIKERILQYIDFKDISKKDFVKNLTMSYENLKGLSLKSELGGDKLCEILLEYDEISPEWLITGKGNMLKSKFVESDCEIQNVNCQDKCKLLHEKERTIQILMGNTRGSRITG